MSEGFAAPGLSSARAFDARPYRPDGGFSLSGLAILTFISCLTGAIIGLVGGFVSQYFFLVVLFPLVMGFVIGAMGAWGVKLGRVRMPIVCGTAGFLGGCVAVAAMHGFSYYRFENELKDVPKEIRAIARNLDQIKPQMKELPPELQELVNKLATDEETRRTLAVSGLLSYIDLQAHHGVEIGGKRNRKAMNLGYTGSYCYWGFELLLIAGIAFAVMKGAAAEPFCGRCDRWKTAEHIASFNGVPEGVRMAVETGELGTIPAHVDRNGDQLNASVFSCPQCGPEGEIDVRVEKVTINGKGESSTSALCTVTYPGEALEPVQEAFASAALVNQPTITPPEQEPLASDAQAEA